jgi:hypothetical protein
MQAQIVILQFDAEIPTRQKHPLGLQELEQYLQKVFELEIRRVQHIELVLVQLVVKVEFITEKQH